MGSLLFGHHHRDRHYNVNVRGLGSDFTAAVIAFLAVVCGVMGGCVWLLDGYLTMEQMIGVAFATGLVVSVFYAARMAKINKMRALEAAREKSNAKEAETQKQIDAMLRGNSRIPKVKR